MAEQRRYNILIHEADGGDSAFWSEVPALPGCFSVGDSLAEILQKTQEAIDLYCDMLREDGDPLPPTDVEPNQMIRVPLTVQAAAS